MLWAVLFVTFCQILLGTQIREEIDLIAFTLGDAQRDKWIQNLGIDFYVHRSFSIVIVAMHAYLAYMLYKLKDARIKRWTNIMLAIVALEIIFGIILSYFSMPPMFQPLHLTFAALLFGAQFMILIIYHYASKKAVNKSVALV